MEDFVRSGAFANIKARAFVYFVLAFAVCASASRANARQNDSADVIAVQTAIENGNRAYMSALKEHDARRFAALFAEDAISLPPFGPPIRGRANIQASIESAFTRVTFLDGSTHTFELQLFSGSAVEIGSYRYSILTDGVPEELRGRYVTMWRFVHGAWKIAIDSSQPGAPETDPVGTAAPGGSVFSSPSPDQR